MAVLFSEQAIRSRITALANEIYQIYKEQDVIVVGVLTGAYLFTADLSRSLWQVGATNIIIDFIGVSSYQDGRESSRNPQITKDMSVDIFGKDVLVVEDIIETGWSLKTLSQLLADRGAKSIRTVVLLDKPGKREVDFVPDFIGFTVPDTAWVEGYGLDTEGKGRGNPELIAR